MSNSNRVAVGHATGNQNVREALRAFGEARLLDSYTTSIGFKHPERMPSGLRRVAERRSYAMLGDAEIRVSPVRELMRITARHAPSRRLRASTGTGGRRGPQWVADGNDARMARDLHKRGHLSAVYGYLGQASRTFEQARTLGIRTVLEAHHAAMPTTLDALERERLRSPEWSATIPDLRNFRNHGLKEIDAADLIVSPSNQVTSSILSARPGARVVNVPYGCPRVAGDARPLEWSGKEPLRLLFVGRLQAVKGLADVAWVLKQLRGAAIITVVGQRTAVECAALEEFLGEANYVGPTSHGEVLNLMRTHHALFLPSIIEGRSLAVLEALSQGLPVLTTPGTGTDDLVSRGGGRLVPIGARIEMLRVIESWIESPDVIEEMSSDALASARSSTWGEFRSQLASSVRGLLGE